MPNEATFLEAASAMIAKRKHELRRVTSRREELRSEIKSLQKSADMYRQEYSISEAIEPGTIKGKTQVQALILIAKRGNGQFRANDAKRLMLEAGLISNPKNAAAIVYTLIKRSDNFEWVSKGVYRLKNYRPKITQLRTA